MGGRWLHSLLHVLLAELSTGRGFLPLVPGICSSPGPTDFPGTLSLEPGALVVV